MPNPLHFSIPSLVVIPALLLPLCAGAVDFEKEVWPILEKKCVECHRAPYEKDGRTKKPKADLRLDADWAILKGSENGKVVEPGKSDESYLFEVVNLPKDDDMFMPPEGKADPLTEAEIAVLKQWIDDGADFGGWKGSDEARPAGGGDKPKPVVAKKSVYDTLAEGLSSPPEDKVKAIEEGGGRVTPLAIDFPLVRVDFISTKEASGDEAVAKLAGIAPSVAQLDLANTQITNASLGTIGELESLVHLDLHSTAVADAGLEKLAGLKNLSYLNLYNTQVTDAGIAKLKGSKSLRRIYLWQSKVTKEGADALQKALPEAKVSFR